MIVKIVKAASAALMVGLPLIGGVTASHAGTAVVTSGGNIAATAPSFRWVTNGTVAINCTLVGLTGTVANGAISGTPAVISSNLLPSFSGCTVAGIPYNFACSPIGRLGAGGNTVAGLTPGIFASFSCVIAIPPIGCTATMSGSLQIGYANSGALTIYAADQSMVMTGSTCANVMPNGTVLVGGTGGTSTSVTNLAYTLGAVKPQVAATGF